MKDELAQLKLRPHSGGACGSGWRCCDWLRSMARKLRPIVSVSVPDDSALAGPTETGHGRAGAPLYPARRRRRIPTTSVALVGHARRELGYGCARTRVLAPARPPGVPVQSTIQRLFQELGLPHLRR